MIKKLKAIFKKLRQEYCYHSDHQGKYIQAVEFASKNKIKYVKWTCTKCGKVLATFRDV